MSIPPYAGIEKGEPFFPDEFQSGFCWVANDVPMRPPVIQIWALFLLAFFFTLRNKNLVLR